MIHNPRFAIEHLKKKVKTQADAEAINVLIKHTIDFQSNLIQQDLNFAKLYLYLFNHGLVTYGSSKESAKLIRDILDVRLEDRYIEIKNSLEDLKNSEIIKNNFVSLEMLSDEGRENLSKIHPNDIKKIKEDVIKLDDLKVKLNELITNHTWNL